MANVIIDNSNLTNIANAIRTKKGVATTYKPSEMAAAIETITTGAAWGQITGTLSNQTDLQSALNTKATIAYSVSEPAGQVEGDFWFDIICEFTITNNLTNCTKVSGPTVITEGEGATLIFSANTGYVLPSSVTVTGATSNWAQSTGTLVLSNATDNVVITIVAEVQTFTITNTLTNCTKTSGANVIAYGSSETLVYTADTGYKLPASVTVTGATGLWAQATGTLVLSNPTSNISITITAEFNPLAVPLCFTANTAGSTVQLTGGGYSLSSSEWEGSYSTDGITWNIYTPVDDDAPIITLTNVGDKVYFKGDIHTSFGYHGCFNFEMTGSIAASGNINSMYVSTDFENLTTLAHEYCFLYTFRGCTSLTSAPLLPATTLSSNCYSYMFNGCTGLTVAPSLPATTFNGYSNYGNMFEGCTNLTTPPSLPATILANGCYCEMFSGCTSLQVNDNPVSGVAEQAWTIPTDAICTSQSSYATDNMFTNCVGTRSTDAPDFTNKQITFYTQNAPV